MPTPFEGIPEFRPERRKKSKETIGARPKKAKPPKSPDPKRSGNRGEILSFIKAAAPAVLGLALLAGIIIAVSHAKILVGVVTSASRTTTATIAVAKTDAVIEMTTATATTALPTTTKLTEQETKPTQSTTQPTTTREPTTKNADALFQEGVQQLQNGKYNAAVLTYDEYLSQRPNDIHALNNLGVAFVFIGRYEAAEALFTSVLDTKVKETTTNARWNRWIAWKFLEKEVPTLELFNYKGMLSQTSPYEKLEINRTSQNGTTISEEHLYYFLEPYTH